MLPDPIETTPVEPVEEVSRETALNVSPATAEILPPARSREPFWDYADLAVVVGLVFASIVVIVVGVFVLSMYYPRLKEDPTPLLLPTQFALYGGIYLAFYLSFKWRYGKPVFASLGWRRGNFNLGIASVGGAALAFAVAGIAALLHTPKVPSPIEKLTDSPVSLALFGIMAVTIAPLFEELFFRGFLQPLLSRSFGVAAGVLLTAVLFGSLHAPEYAWAWQYVLAVSLAGAVFGWMRARTNSIIPSTIMHGCYNAVFVIAFAISKH